jgi:hypothetical protein
MQTNE